MTEELKQKAEEYAITYGIGDNFNVADYIDFAVKFTTKVTKELQEENEQLKDKLGNVQMQKAGEKSDLVWKLMNRKEELEKENTELKVQNKWLEGCKSELAEHLGKANDRIAKLEKGD